MAAPYRWAAIEVGCGAVALAGGRSRQQRRSSNRGVGQRRGSIGDIDKYGGVVVGGGGGGNGAVHTIDTTRQEMSTAAVGNGGGGGSE